MPILKKKKKEDEGAPQWLLTYGDMTTLLLTFFIMMFTTAEIDGSELRMILAAFQGLGIMRGGNTLQMGKLAELGNNIMALPSMERGRALDKAREQARSLFQQEIRTKKVRIKEDERGLIISLSAELFFDPGRARINIEEARGLLESLAGLLRSPELDQFKFRIEGHTDSAPTDPTFAFPDEGPYETNWELSVQRSLNVLKYLVNYGVDENKMQVAGFAETVPLSGSDYKLPITRQVIEEANETEAQRASNRRVDIVILTQGHL